MYDVELRRTERLLRFKTYLGAFKNKDIYIFGVSDNTRQIIKILRECGIEPKNVIDNDKSKQGSFCSRLKVISLQEINNIDELNKVYIMYSAYWREMVQQLVNCGVSKRNIFRLNRRPGLFIFHLINVIKGKKYRKKLIKKYGNIPIFLCPYTGTGDIYLIGTFWNEYTKQNRIDNYIFVVITGACKKVATMFDIKNIEVTKKKEYGAFLLDYYLFNPEKGKVKILNDCWAQVHTNQVEWFRGYKGLYFTQLFRKYVFNLNDDVKPQRPILNNNLNVTNELFNKYKLVEDKTVVLSPYSNTLSDLPNEFWEQLAFELKAKGYTVITNSSGKTEPAIKGTTGIFFPLNIAPQFIEKAGAFIGVRSGFCDVISSANAKKIIMYDKGNRFYMGSAFEYFNLKDMELCDDAIEIEFTISNIEDTLNQIMGEF